MGTHPGLEKQTLPAVGKDPGRTPPKVSPQEYWGVGGQDTNEGRGSQEEVGEPVSWTPRARMQVFAAEGGKA